jgi:hypothetical protein
LKTGRITGAYLNANGTFRPGAPEVLSSPFSGFLFTGAGAAGIDVINNRLRSPMVHQFNVGIEKQIGQGLLVKADGVHNLGTRFIIGRPVGTVYNPDTQGPDNVTDLESAVNTKYDALWVSLSQHFAKYGEFDAAYTLAKAFNYTNDDQIPFEYSPIVRRTACLPTRCQADILSSSSRGVELRSKMKPGAGCAEEAPCPILSPLFWRMGGKPRPSNGHVHQVQDERVRLAPRPAAPPIVVVSFEALGFHAHEKFGDFAVPSRTISRFEVLSIPGVFPLQGLNRAILETQKYFRDRVGWITELFSTDDDMS